MTLALLDTNAYLRLAKRIRPLLGKPFGQKGYVLTILKQIEDEVHRNPRLKFNYPWFTDSGLSAERFAKQVRLGKEERIQIEAAASVLAPTFLPTHTATRHMDANRLLRPIVSCWRLAKSGPPSS